MKREQEIPHRFLNLAKTDPLLARLVKDDLLDVLLTIFLTADTAVN